MAKQSWLIFLFVSPLGAATLQSDPVVLRAGVTANAKKLIFLDFHNEANDANLAFLSNSLSEAVNTAIKGKYRYSTISPAQWKKYASEKKWQPADFSDAKKIRQMGLDLGADGVIFGRFKPVADTLELQGVILSVVDGETLAHEKSSTKQDSTMFNDIKSLAERLAAKIQDLFIPSDRGALWRAAALPGWGHFYKERRGWGYFWSIGTGSAAALTLASTTVFLVYRGKYQQSSPELYRNSAGHIGLYDEAAAQAEFDRLESVTNQWGKVALAGLITTAVFYAGNLLHAWLIKPDLGNVTAGAQQAFKFSVTSDEAQGRGTRISMAFGYAF